MSSIILKGVTFFILEGAIDHCGGVALPDCGARACLSVFHEAFLLENNFLTKKIFGQHKGEIKAMFLLR